MPNLTDYFTQVSHFAPYFVLGLSGVRSIGPNPNQFQEIEG